MNSLFPCFCSCLSQSRGALVLAQMWYYGTEVELDVQGKNPGPPSWHRHCCAGPWKRTGWRGGERSVVRKRQLSFSPLLLDSRSICWIRQFRGNVRKESSVKFSLSAYSRDTIKTLESGSRGNSIISEVHLEGAPAHSSATLYTWVK